MSAAPRPAALTTRFLDFWLLGGASLLVWIVMFAADGFRTSWAVDQHFKNLTVTTASLALLVNYPHFLISYKLAYSRGASFVLGHWWQLIAVPVLLTALFAAAYRYFDVRVETIAWLAGASQTLRSWGANAQLLAGPRVGDLLFTAAFNLMILTIGWHYTKQVFGCMMVYAHLDAYPVSRAQRAITKWALLGVWVMNFVSMNVGGEFRAFGTFSYSSLDLPDIALPVSELLVGAGIVLVLHRVFYANYRSLGRLPSVNMVVPFAAIYVWWLPQTRQYEFFFLLTPLFHSLQYLPFAYKVEDTRLRDLSRPQLRATAIVVGIVAAGWLAFELLPDMMDSWLGTVEAWGFLFFFTAAMLFINIHHYFIDNVIWRMKDPVVRRYLLG